MRALAQALIAMSSATTPIAASTMPRPSIIRCPVVSPVKRARPLNARIAARGHTIHFATIIFPSILSERETGGGADAFHPNRHASISRTIPAEMIAAKNMPIASATAGCGLLGESRSTQSHQPIMAACKTNQGKARNTRMWGA